MVALVFTSCTPTPEPADLVLVGGKFVTLDPARPEATALAARAGKIVAVGSDEQIRAFIGPRTEGVQLDGRLAVPGFIESHGHLRNLGILRMNVDLKTTRSWEEIVERVREAAAAREARELDLRAGMAPGEVGSRARADRRGISAPGRAERGRSGRTRSLLRHASGHAAIANLAALHAAGIDRAAHRTRPAAGSSATAPGARPVYCIETAEDPVEQAMDDALARRAPAEIDAETFRAVEIAQDECLRKGVTTFEDAGSPFATIDLLKRMAEDGRLRMRLWVMVRDDNALAAGAPLQVPVRRLGSRLPDGARDQAADRRRARLARRLAACALCRSTVDLGIEHRARRRHRGDGADRDRKRLSSSASTPSATEPTGETLDLYERTFRAHPDKKNLRWRVEHAQHLSPVRYSAICQARRRGVDPGIHCVSDGSWVPARIGAKRAEEGAYVWRRADRFRRHPV